MLHKSWRGLRHNKSVVRSATTSLFVLQIFYLTSSPALAFAATTVLPINNALSPDSSSRNPMLKVTPQIPINGGDRTADDYGTSLGEGIALVMTTLATDPSIPIVPAPGLTPAESPTIEASTGQVIAPIVQSLPAHTELKAAILIGGHAVKIATLKTGNSTSISIPPMVGTQDGTWLIQITSKSTKYYYKVMFSSFL